MAVVDEDVNNARKLHLAGFFFLPWLWLVSAIYYYEASKTNVRLAYYVRRNLIGFAFFTTILVAWIIVFQLEWRNWGSTGRALLVVQVEDPDDW